MISNNTRSFLIKAFLLIFFAVLSKPDFGQQKKYAINITESSKKIKAGALDLGGSDHNGNTIAVNNYYISYNNKPIIPVTGEFHFSRYPEKYWDESIKKMKAGGITVIATYVFWIMHEEHEGVFNWSGNRDVRKFITLCKENDMPVIIRIGPFCHGEIRNGGLPDWLLAKPYSVRSNDPGYLSVVEKLYNEIGIQLNGLYFKDGGPIIATQIENEYQHSASPWGLTYPGQPFDWTASARDLAVTHQGVAVSDVKNPYAEMGRDHMKVLKQLAVKAGIQTPLYTATGWGNAAIIENESLPVTAAYAYPTWTAKADTSMFYLYKDLTRKPDYAPVSYTPQNYPAFAAELGSGIMSTYSRRPIVPANSIDALINRCLGSGANGLGYYMFHGGSTPKGDFYFNDEAYGYPKISYDFQAPIGEYGQVRPSFQRLKLIHFFLKDFGDLLAPMALTLPDGYDEIKPTNLETLRYSVRSDGNRGFLFINNFQDDATPTDKNDLTVDIQTKSGVIDFPISIKSGENAIYPFNLNINGVNLKYATAQLLMKSDDAEDPFYTFFVNEEEQPVFVFSKSSGLKIKNLSSSKITQTGNDWKVLPSKNANAEFSVELKGKKTRILVLTKAMALKAYILQTADHKVLCFSDALPLQNKNEVEFLNMADAKFNFSIYPKSKTISMLPNGNLIKLKNESLFSEYKVLMPDANIKLDYNLSAADNKFQIKLPDLQSGVNDYFLNVDYVGDTGMAFINGTLVADDFYKGLKWEIGLKQFLDDKKAHEMQFYFRPIYKNAPYLVDLNPEDIPDFAKSNKILSIKKIALIPQYKMILKLDF